VYIGETPCRIRAHMTSITESILSSSLILDEDSIVKLIEPMKNLIYVESEKGQQFSKICMEIISLVYACTRSYRIFLYVFFFRLTSHTILRLKDILIKDIFSSKYCSDILKYFQTRLSKNRYFQFTQEKKYWMKNVFLSFYCNNFLSQYCVQKYCV